MEDNPSGTSRYHLTIMSDKTPEELTPIELAALLGSGQIFKYLIMGKVKIHNSIWNYALYGGCPEIIHILKDLERPRKDLEEYCSCPKIFSNLPYRFIIDYLHDNYSYKFLD